MPEAAVETASEETEEIIEQSNVIKDITLQDKRSALKKTIDGVSSVTGFVASTAGYVVSRPLLASTILIIIILGTLTYYSRGFIMTKIKGKKSGDTTKIFEDFKYEENK